MPADDASVASYTVIEDSGAPRSRRKCLADPQRPQGCRSPASSCPGTTEGRAPPAVLVAVGPRATPELGDGTPCRPFLAFLASRRRRGRRLQEAAQAPPRREALRHGHRPTPRPALEPTEVRGLSERGPACDRSTDHRSRPHHDPGIGGRADRGRLPLPLHAVCPRSLLRSRRSPLLPGLRLGTGARGRRGDHVLAGIRLRLPQLHRLRRVAPRQGQRRDGAEDARRREHLGGPQQGRREPDAGTWCGGLVRQREPRRVGRVRQRRHRVVAGLQPRRQRHVHALSGRGELSPRASSTSRTWRRAAVVAVERRLRRPRPVRCSRS